MAPSLAFASVNVRDRNPQHQRGDRGGEQFEPVAQQDHDFRLQLHKRFGEAVQAQCRSIWRWLAPDSPVRCMSIFRSILTPSASISRTVSPNSGSQMHARRRSPEAGEQIGPDATAGVRGATRIQPGWLSPRRSYAGSR